jgi:signal transduction histidine kinase
MKPPLFILFFSILYCSVATAQSDKPPLKHELSASSPDNSQLLYDLSKKYEENNLDSCFYFLKASLDIAQRRNNAFTTAQAMYGIGNIYTFKLRNDAKGIEWLNKAILIAKKNNDSLNLAKSYQSLAFIASYQNSNQANELLSKALNYAQASNDWEVISMTYDLIGNLCKKQKKYDEAEQASFNAMRACENHSPDDYLSYGLDYADFLFSNGKKDAAYAFSQKLNGVRDKLTHRKGEFVYLMDLARLDIRLKQFSSADSTLQRLLSSEKTKTKPDTFHLVHTYRNLLSLYIAEGSTEKAYEIIEDLTKIRVASKEKRLTQDSKVKMVELKSALELEQKESQIVLLDEQKKNQRLFLIGAVVIALLLGGFLVILQRNKRRIEQQKAELTALNATKDKLFALLSHDLMSPIVALKNYTMLIDWGAMNQTQFIESIENLKININNLYNMLQNVLYWSMSQMRGITPKKEKVNIAHVIKEQITLFEPITKGKDIHITQTIPENAIIDVDRNHLALIVRNLLQNTLKFTNKGGTIHLEYQNTEGGQKLIIRDTGIGMTPDILAKLFKTDENTNRKGTGAESGTGLGLILTKELVELNGGMIDVSSEVGKGTTFTLTFA